MKMPLALNRKIGESIIIGEDAWITLAKWGWEHGKPFIQLMVEDGEDHYNRVIRPIPLAVRGIDKAIAEADPSIDGCYVQVFAGEEEVFVFSKNPRYDHCTLLIIADRKVEVFREEVWERIQKERGG